LKTALSAVIAHPGPFQILATFTALSLLACAESPPTIGSHLGASADESSAVFDQQVKARFPVGSDESALRKELLGERFVIIRNKDSPFRFSATYSASELFCRQDWIIRWNVNAGKIADIGGKYWLTCAHDFM
jgi:hypothetical protein